MKFSNTFPHAALLSAIASLATVSAFSFASPASANDVHLNAGESILIGQDRISCGTAGHIGCYTSNKCLLQDGRTAECSGGAADFVLNPRGYCITEKCHFSHEEALQELRDLTRRGYCN